jgi:hypothetical protein
MRNSRDGADRPIRPFNVQVVIDECGRDKREYDRKIVDEKKSRLIKTLGRKKYTFYMGCLYVAAICLYLTEFFREIADKFNKKAFSYKPDICMDNHYCFNGSVGAYFQNNPKGKKAVKAAADKMWWRTSTLALTKKVYDPFRKEMFDPTADVDYNIKEASRVGHV